MVRDRKLLPLLASVALGAWQARMGLRLGVEPGAELKEAARTAEEVDAEVHLVDRQVRTTLLRVWRRAGFRQRVKLLASGLESGSADEPTKEDIEELLSGDVVSRLVSELGEAFPTLKEVVIDERDTWIGEAVKAVPGGRLVVVIGAGHLDGVERTLLAEEAVSTEPLAEIPPPGRSGRIVGFAIPAIILGALGWTWAVRGAEAASDGALFWIAVNSIPAAIGAALALGAPAHCPGGVPVRAVHQFDPGGGDGLRHRVRAGVGAASAGVRIAGAEGGRAGSAALVPEPGAQDRAGADPADHREHLRNVRGRGQG